jgi:L-ascorbate metabolism protein UlaG (beta-lactamase superfamily)
LSTRKPGRFSWRDLKFLKFLLPGRGPTIPDAPHRPEPGTWKNDRLTTSWLGHSTVLANFHGTMLVTDPVLGSRCGLHLGPWTFGPHRLVAPALRVGELPPIDLVVLTHAHFDHLDTWTLRQIVPHDCPVITPTHVGELARDVGFRDVHELDWGESLTLPTRGGDIRAFAFRVRHWGARMRNDEHRRYNGYVLEKNGLRLCVAGDTAHTDVFKTIGGADLVLMPIGAYDPWIASHCNPEQAVEMADDAGARFVLPIHHQTFRLSVEALDEPIRRFCAALEPERVALREIGETFVLPES